MLEKGLRFPHPNWTETPPSIFLKNKTIQKTQKMDATSTINCYCWILLSLCDSPQKYCWKPNISPLFATGTLLSRSNDFPKIPPKAVGFWCSLVPSRLEDIIPGLDRCLGSPHIYKPFSFMAFWRSGSHPNPILSVLGGLGRVVGGHRADALAHSVLAGFLVVDFWAHFCKQKISIMDVY